MPSVSRPNCLFVFDKLEEFTFCILHLHFGIQVTLAQYVYKVDVIDVSIVATHHVCFVLLEQTIQMS